MPKRKKIKPKLNGNHKYLQVTNLLLIISFLYFLTTSTPHPTQKVEFVLASSLVATVTLSQLFWHHPIQHSRIHKVDAIVAKTVILSCVSYTVVYKFQYSFLVLLSGIVSSAYFSHHFSNIEWCSDRHLVSHGCLHILCFIATFYTFDPKPPSLQ